MTNVSRSTRADVDQARRLYEIAARIKLTDKRVRKLLTSGQLQANYYSPAGHELIAASIGAALGREDYLCTTYRGLQDQVAKGVPLDLLLAEYFGRVTGACKGKGGPMHITHRPSNLLLTTGIVGSGLPIATGLGWAAALRGEGQVVVVTFGDGASNIGAFHESLNLAAVWKLPVVFVCANNLYAEHTPYEAGTSSATIAQRSAAYDIPGVVVNGKDAFETSAAITAAVDRARAGDGPSLVEARTFRLYGHNMNDGHKYMRTGELAAARESEPVAALRTWLTTEGEVAEGDLAALEQGIEAELDAAVEFARASDVPGPEELYIDVYAEVTNR